MGLELITPPQSTPVTLEEAKAHLRVEHTDDDVLIEALIESATAALDGRYGLLGRALEPQSWELVMDRFPCWPYGIEIPLPPLLAVDEITYIDADLAVQTVDAATYEFDTTCVPGRLRPIGTGLWPASACLINAVRVRFTAGYALRFADSGDVESDGSVTYSTVPSPIKAAIKIMVNDMYETRESVAPGITNKLEIPTTVERLLSPYRIPVFA